MKTIIEAATYLPKHAVPRLNPKTLIVDKLQSHIQNTCAAELSESTRRGKKWRHSATEAMGSLSEVTLGGADLIHADHVEATSAAMCPSVDRIPAVTQTLIARKVTI